MFAERWVVGLLRVFLVLLFGILVVFQTLSLPGKFRYMAHESPDLAYLQWPLTGVSAFWLLCVEVVIVCTWRLLTLVVKDRIFSEASLRWVDAIVWAVFAGWVVLVGLSAFVVLNADDPGPPMVLLLLSTGVTVLGLLLLVMRALLRRATVLRTDLEAVI